MIRRTPTLAWVIEIVDDGLRLYRQFWSDFLLAATLTLVPFTLVMLITSGVIISNLGTGWAALAVLITFALGFETVCYTSAVLSRMTIDAATGRRPRIRAALRISPIRLIGMGCYAFVFSIVAASAAGMVATLVACTIGFGSTIFLLAVPHAGLALSPFALVLGTVSTFSWLLVMCGVILSIVFAVQAFALDDRSMSKAVRAMHDLLFFRLWRNILCFMIGGAIFAAALMAYAGTLIAGTAYVFSSGSSSGVGRALRGPVVGNAISLVILIGSVAIFLPCMASWMALLYTRVKAEREGTDIAQRIAAWVGQTPGAADPAHSALTSS